MGGVDLVQSDMSLAGPWHCYDLIKAAVPFIPSLAHFDSGNYMSNWGNAAQDVATVPDYALNRLGASHISWYRACPSDAPSNYAKLTAYLNTLHTQAEWESSAYASGGLATTGCAAIR